jgi:NAD(P)-dependent dehydrogenase (short-subunit alcohol dehydrogenase family)
MALRFENKVAFVTGAGSGIGRAAAQAFAAEGAKVVVSDVDETTGAETVAAIKQAGGEARFIPCDVTDAAQARAAIEATVSAYGQLDCAFNNAGVLGQRLHVHEYPEQEFERIVRIHLFGVFYCLKYEIIQMQRQGGGAIVNTSSVAGLLGSPLACAYAAAKHGIAGLSKSAAVDNALANIRVNAICPGIIDTPLTRTGFENLEERSAIAHPIGRLGQPHEVAAAVLWLCSDAASFITGIAMPVDGGWTAKM